MESARLRKRESASEWLDRLKRSDGLAVGRKASFDPCQAARRQRSMTELKEELANLSKDRRG